MCVMQVIVHVISAVVGVVLVRIRALALRWVGGGLVVTCLTQRVAEPFKTFVETISRRGAG